MCSTGNYSLSTRTYFSVIFLLYYLFINRHKRAFHFFTINTFNLANNEHENTTATKNITIVTSRTRH